MALNASFTASFALLESPGIDVRFKERGEASADFDTIRILLFGTSVVPLDQRVAHIRTSYGTALYGQRKCIMAPGSYEGNSSKIWI
jgi:hypothetical protein